MESDVTLLSSGIGASTGVWQKKSSGRQRRSCGSRPPPRERLPIRSRSGSHNTSGRSTSRKRWKSQSPKRSGRCKTPKRRKSPSKSSRTSKGRSRSKGRSHSRRRLASRKSRSSSPKVKVRRNRSKTRGKPLRSRKAWGKKRPIKTNSKNARSKSGLSVPTQDLLEEAPTNPEGSGDQQPIGNLAPTTLGEPQKAGSGDQQPIGNLAPKTLGEPQKAWLIETTNRFAERFNSEKINLKNISKLQCGLFKEPRDKPLSFESLVEIYTSTDAVESLNLHPALAVLVHIGLVSDHLVTQPPLPCVKGFVANQKRKLTCQKKENIGYWTQKCLDQICIEGKYDAFRGLIDLAPCVNLQAYSGIIGPTEEREVMISQALEYLVGRICSSTDILEQVVCSNSILWYLHPAPDCAGTSQLPPELVPRTSQLHVPVDRPRPPPVPVVTYTSPKPGLLNMICRNGSFEVFCVQFSENLIGYKKASELEENNMGTIQKSTGPDDPEKILVPIWTVNDEYVTISFFIVGAEENFAVDFANSAVLGWPALKQIIKMPKKSTWDRPLKTFHHSSDIVPYQQHTYELLPPNVKRVLNRWGGISDFLSDFPSDFPIGHYA